ncbi:GNAT family N-acetyltransferase [Loigolactobacillus iwatensis]|uniref:GNAT family N-acetyltransferase n=1 Tax=Loigolactobacillus iwatensis TaxID=1267156 RepID=UPI000F7D620A|nr:GNAT family N-acetyltransferase [Loigolactobacillus iwatensis]
MQIKIVNKLNETQLQQVMSIWLLGNTQAHDFIQPDYWRKNYAAVAKQIQDARLILAEQDDQICGFLGLVDAYIAGLFVRKDVQNQGLGTKLVARAKAIKSPLTLSVYQKNDHAVKFYQAHGFVIVKQGVDVDTNEVEFTMEAAE